MKFLLAVFTVFLIISGCQPTLYNSIDIYVELDDLGIERPVDLFASGGSYRNSVLITWVFYMQLNITFQVYRSEFKDKDFKILKEEINTTYYMDTSAVPGITYYYKVKAVSLMNGESDFSDVVSGFRAGLAIDKYEDDSLENPLTVSDRVSYHRSIYPENERDYFRIDSEPRQIRIMYIEKTDNSLASLDDFSMKIYSSADMSTPKHEVADFKSGRGLTIVNNSGNSVFVELTSKNANTTGDYIFRTELVESKNIINNLKVSNDYSGYIKINWDRESFFNYYKVERRKADEDEWQYIGVSTTIFRRDVETDITTSGSVYDFNCLPDVKYVYRVSGYVDKDFFRYSIDNKEGIRNSVKEDEFMIGKDSEFLKLPVNIERRMTENNNSHTVSAEFTADKSYMIKVNYKSSYKMTAGLSIYDSKGTRIFFQPPLEDVIINVNNFKFSGDGVYSIKVDCFTDSGAYVLEIMEN